MAIYHFSAKVISRATGRSAVAAAAYRSASRLHDQRLGRPHDFSNKAGVVHSEVLLPEGAPEEFTDRETLWNAVETAEKRIDAQLAREIEFAIPRELNEQQGIALARDFVAREFVDRGMIADLNVHWDVGADGEAKPHAHVMLTMREVDESGFGAKVRDWNRTELLQHWREAWGIHVNERLAQLDIDVRIDHRSLARQGIDLEPQHKIGPAASRMAAQGLESERLEEHRAIARSNGERIIANPSIALDAITHTRATFTRRDLAMLVHRHSADKDQFDLCMAAVRGSPELVALGKDGRGEERFTSRDMIATEQRLEHAVDALAARSGHAIPAAALGREIAAAGTHGLVLSGEQKTALDHITRGPDLAVVIGYAGTGKSTMLGVAREAWESAGYRVQGLALSGIAAENLENGSGIASRTIASIEHQWAQDRDLLSCNDIVVIDEAGMVGTRQMERVIAQCRKHGAKVVLIGDPEQLQAIEAGAAFRAIHEHQGGVEITDIRRQHEGWQRDATRQLATGRTGEAIAAYAERDHVHAAATREDARKALIARWDRDRMTAPQKSRIILTHTRDEVQALNDMARTRLRAAQQLGDDVAIETTRGARAFARDDRVMFLRNEHSMGVKNGSLGRIQSVTAQRMSVLLDDGRRVAFDVKHYADLDHGYAATIHKAQGVTVDRAHVLATPGLDRHAAYVALSRHRETVQLHYGQDDFADQDKLVRTLARERTKDMASDYARSFAERRNIQPPSPKMPARDRFDRLDLTQAAPPSLERAAQRFASATAEIVGMRQLGLDELPHQRAAFDAAHHALDAIRPEAARDLRSAFVRDMQLIDEMAAGNTRNAARILDWEQRYRSDPAFRADVFVQRWQAFERQRRLLLRDYEDGRAGKIADTMVGLAKSLERDPQVESILRNRRQQLGLPAMPERGIGQSLADMLGRGRSRGPSIGM